MANWARGVVGGEIDDQVRFSFWRAFGITPDLQESLEQCYGHIQSFESTTPVMCSHTSQIDQQNPLTTWLAAVADRSPANPQTR